MPRAARPTASSPSTAARPRPSGTSSISAIVQAAIDTTRSVELDAFIVRQILDRAGELQQARSTSGAKPLRFSINLTPASLLDRRFEAKAIAAMIREVGLTPHQVTIECTEQQAVEDVEPLRRQAKALRRLGFGFAIDDAGAGYASFALIAALRPSIIKIDRQIIHGIRTDDARQALVEAFVSFGRRIGARLAAEGIETRRELATLTGLGVELGQGFLLGRPSAQPSGPRRRPAPTTAAVDRVPGCRQPRRLIRPVAVSIRSGRLVSGMFVGPASTAPAWAGSNTAPWQGQSSSPDALS